jgi:tetratricopeptide (TPR) repeat protein
LIIQGAASEAQRALDQKLPQGCAMADTNKNQDYSEAMAAEFGEQGPARDFYDDEVNRYTSVLDENLDKAFKQYGFTLFHSLPAGKQVQVAQKLGMMKGDAIDNFNLAGLSIEKEEWPKAIDLLKKALQQDGTLADAEYNLAMCYERQGNAGEAGKHWKKFLEISDDEEVNRQVTEHLNAPSNPSA